MDLREAMDEQQFQNWMKRMPDVDESASVPTAGAIWWRAQLRRRLDAEERATRPIRIAEGAAGISCWLLAGVVSAGLGTGAIIAFLTITAAAVGGFRANAFERTGPRQGQGLEGR
jgi:hypothetical protein